MPKEPSLKGNLKFARGAEIDLFDKFEQFFRTRYKNELLEVANNYPIEKSIEVDFSDIDKFDTELADTILSDPEETLKVAEEALSEIDLSIEGDYKISIRVGNLPASHFVNVRDIRSDHLEKFIAVEGIVKSAAEVRPEAVRVTFQCPECGKELQIYQTDKKLKTPYMCDDPTCSARGRFKEVRVDLVDTQRIKIQEPPETITGGEQPSEIYLILTDDLVSPDERKKTMPGNRIKVTGILKKVPYQTRAGATTTRYDLHIKANHVFPIEREFEEIELSDEDIKQIKKLSKDPNLYEKMINSIAPSIYGYAEIKEAILLQLFGGVPKTQPDGTKIRGNVHIFLIGDPAVGKSQLLWYVSRLAPKGRFVSGQKASGVGLTAAVVRDEFSGWTLEAGAMVLANKGIAAVDEFDKMTDEDRSAMLEAMEQGTVSIAKAGIVTTLRASTSVLAAANPKYGRFDIYKPLSDQLDMSPVILSRFDLKFPIQDIPDPERDMKLAEHVLESFISDKDIQPEIPAEDIRKYIAYARTHFKPVLTHEAKDLIKDFYLLWRKKYAGDSGESTVSLSPRQLEALIRISEASAKVRLGSKVTVEDARRAIHLLEFSLKALGTEPETGQIDIDRIDVGISSAQRSKFFTIMGIIDDLTKEIGKDIPFEEIARRAEEQGIERNNVQELINKLRKKGDLFEPKTGFIQKA